MKAFHLNAENFPDMQAKLEPQLEHLKIKQKDILNAELLVEEIFWRMVNLGKIEQVKVLVEKNFFGKVQIQMTAQGASFNPLVEISDWDEEDEEYYRTLILKANRQKLSWLYKNNRNVITISVRNERNLQLKLTLAGMFGGIICGVIMKENFSPEMIAAFNEMIVQPCEEMFLNALGLLIVPVIFFSVACGVNGMSSAGFGRVGAKLSGLYLFIDIIAVLVCLNVAEIFFGGGVSQISTLPAADASVEVIQFSFMKFIIDIIPSDFISPIEKGKILQVIFIAVFFGATLNSLGDKVSHFKNLLRDLNEIFIRMLTLLMLLMPLIVFIAMIRLALDTDAETLILVMKLLAADLISATLLVIFCPILVRCVGKISPIPLLKKVPALIPPSFATSSSGAIMPQMMKLCTNKLGVAEKISSFSIPLGVTFNTVGSLICIITASFMFLKMYDVELSFYNLATISFLALLFSFGAPDFVSIITITNHFGVPMEIAALVFCVDTFSDRLGTCVNVFSNMTATLTLARSENLLDDKIYFN